MASEPAPTTVAAPISREERAQYRPKDLKDCLETVRRHFDAYAPQRDTWRSRTYRRLLKRYYRFYVPKGARILEIGSGTGDLLADLAPSHGVGVDLSPEMTRVATEKYPHLKFVTQEVEFLDLKDEKPFDYIILSDVLGFLFDIQAVFRVLRRYCDARTRIIINVHSRLWQPALDVAERLGLKYRQPVLNWVTTDDVVNLLELAGFQTVATDSRIVMPLRIPLVAMLLNRVLAPFAPFRWFCLTNWIVARLPMALPEDYGVSVVCPCRNEAGNIPAIVERLPDMPPKMELIFVEGHSKDETLAACKKIALERKDRDISVYQQTGKGKGDAVRLGFEKAKYEILMILDADMTVRPEDLPSFVDAIRSGHVEFVNGSRFVYPMEGRAMRFLNLLGNKFFSGAFSFLIGQTVKDTLCGTKVLLKRDYEHLVAQREYFGDFDPFGDFDLLFGSARLGLRIADLPIRYMDRTYGTTNISRFRHGLILLGMCFVALRKLKMR